VTDVATVERRFRYSGDMRGTWMRFGLAVAVAVMACGSSSGPTHVEISGRTPSEGAAIAAQAVCGQAARCGGVTIACMGGGTAGGSGSDAAPPSMHCEATIEPISRDACVADASGDIEELLSCPTLTAEQVDTLETCFDALAAQPCITQAEADERARAAEVGISPPADETPAACALLKEPPPGC
jgi:hypothetical protein